MRGVSQGMGTQPPSQFFTLGTSKNEVFETSFFDIVLTQNDHLRDVKHVLGHIYVFPTLFWVLGPGGGGSPKGWVHTLLLQISPGSSKIDVFEAWFL